MAVENKKAATLPDLSSAKPGAAAVQINHGVLRTSSHLSTVTTGDSATSTFEVARIPSHARISKLSKLHTAGVAGLTDVDLGVSGGTVDCLVNGVSLAGAVAADGAAEIAVADHAKQLWEIAGLAKDPKAELSIILTLNTAATGPGTVLADLVYITE